MSIAKRVDKSIIMYKDFNRMFVVIHNNHVIVRTYNLAVADKSYKALGGK